MPDPLSNLERLATSRAAGDGDDGYRLWLRYAAIADARLLAELRSALRGILVAGASPTLAAAGRELEIGLAGLLGRRVPVVDRVDAPGVIVVGTPASSPIVAR